MDMRKFHDDQRLDPNHLDMAAALQAETFFHWAQQAVHARKVADRVKLNVELVENLLSSECRLDPESFHLIKITEAAISSAVKNHPDYKAAMENLIDARHEMSLLDAAVEAMEQRKRMIEVLITLHGQQYFAGPSVPHDLVSAWSDYQEGNREALLKRQPARLPKTGKVSR